MSDKLLSKFKKERICLEHINACPFFAESSARGFTMPFFKFKEHYDLILTYCKDNQLDLITSIDDQDRLGKNIVKISRHNKDFFSKIYRQWKNNFKEFYVYCLNLKKTDFAKLSNADLLNVLREYYKKLFQIRFPALIDGFIFYADRYFPVLINDFCAKRQIKNPRKIISILSAPTEDSFLADKAKDFYKIAISISKQRFNFKKISSNKKLLDDINNYLEKYFWIKGSYADNVEYGETDVVSESLKIIKNGLKKPRSAVNARLFAKQSALNKYHFTPEIKNAVNIIELFAKWHDDRKIYTLLHVYLDGKFLDEIARRFNIDKKLLKYSFSKELSLLLAGKLKSPKLKNILRKRKNGSLWLYSGGKILKIISGKKANKIFRTIKNSYFKGVASEIKGMTASLGKVSGRVTVVKNIEDIDKVKKGDVLITTMTRPEYASIFGIIRAIVTDEGGITCHAAIISRELNIPCIIGAKNATRILKDGQLVEVDADKGVVKILKK